MERIPLRRQNWKLPFKERYKDYENGGRDLTVSGKVVRVIQLYMFFYEDLAHPYNTDPPHPPLSDPVDEITISEFLLDAIAQGYTLAAPPLVLPNTHQQNMMGTTVYFFLDLSPEQLTTNQSN